MNPERNDRDNLIEVCVVLNGPLGMSAGKMVGQAFQAALRSIRDGNVTGEATVDWLNAGSRTVVRIAKTPAIFERVCTEVPGYVMRDEGFTEVEEGAATLFVSHPFLHRDRPQVLNNKKVPLA